MARSDRRLFISGQSRCDGTGAAFVLAFVRHEIVHCGGGGGKRDKHTEDAAPSFVAPYMARQTAVVRAYNLLKKSPATSRKRDGTALERGVALAAKLIISREIDLRERSARSVSAVSLVCLSAGHCARHTIYC